MNRAQRIRSDRRNQRGVALAYVGLAMLAFMGFAVIGVDTARIAFTASEAQATADAAASAGVRTLANVVNGGAGNVKQDAVTVAAVNRVDGSPSPITTNDVVCGTWDFTNHAFSAGAACDNTATAVKATANKQVNNIVAGVLGSPNSTVTRAAISALSAPSAARPVWPIAIEDCAFQQYASSGNCSDLPKAIVAPTPGQTACLTAFLDQSATPNIIQYLPTSCGGGGGAQASISIGTNITLTNGAKVPDFSAMKACWQQGLTDWVIPIVPCDHNCNQQSPVLAFAEIHVTNVVAKGSTSSVTMDTLCKVDTQTTSGGGGTDRGVKTIAMVQ